MNIKLSSISVGLIGAFLSFISIFGFSAYTFGAQPALTVPQGGTGTSTQITNGVNYFNGTRITSDTQFTWDKTTLTLPNLITQQPGQHSTALLNNVLFGEDGYSFVASTTAGTSFSLTGTQFCQLTSLSAPAANTSGVTVTFPSDAAASAACGTLTQGQWALSAIVNKSAFPITLATSSGSGITFNYATGTPSLVENTYPPTIPASTTAFFLPIQTDATSVDFNIILFNPFGKQLVSTGIGGLVSYDAFTHPTNASSATTSLLLFNGNASSTLESVYGPAYFGGTATSSFDRTGALTLITPLLVASGGTGTTTTQSSRIYYGGGNGTFQSVATSSLSTNGTSISNTGAMGAMIGGSSATISLNMANANTWTALQTFAFSTSTGSSFSYASSTLWFGGGLVASCNGTSFLQWTSGQFGCAVPAGSAGIGDPFTHVVAGTSATTTLMLFNGNASSTQESASTLFFNVLSGTSTTATSTFLGALQMGSTASDNKLYLNCNDRSYPLSVTVGGCLHIDNGTTNAGPGLEFVTNYATVGAGRGVFLNARSTSFDAELLYASSSASAASTVGMVGAPTNKGILKITHTGGSGNSNSAGVSIDLLNCTDCQGIFIDETGHVAATSTKILNLRGNGTEVMTLTAPGYLGLGTTTPNFNLDIASSTGPQMVLADGSATSNQWGFRSINSALYIATTSPSTFATSTSAAISIDVNGQVSVNTLKVNSIGSALALSTSGVLSAYAGSSACSNQAGTQVSATGVLSCSSINNAWWSGTQLSVANGGTGQTTFTSSQLLYGNGTNALSSVGTSSPTFNGGLTTSGTAGAWVGGSAYTVSLANVNANSLLGVIGGAAATPTSVATSSLFIGTTGQTAYFSGTGALVGTSTLFMSTGSYVGISSTTPTNMLSLGSLNLSQYGSIAVTENKLATSTSMTIDWTKGNQQLIQLGASATTIGFSNASTTGQQLKLIVCNPGAAAGAITWNNAGVLRWAGGSAPSQTTTANKCDVWSFLVTQATSTSAASPQTIFGAQTASF